MTTLYSIGHSNLSIQTFLEVLDAFEIQLVVDVRSAPFSRFAPHFNRAELEHALTEHQLDYRYAGDFLGGRPTDASLYRDGVIPSERHEFLQAVDYERVAQTASFRRGIDRLIDLAKNSTTTVLCSEENPRECHRHYLIERNLNERANMQHIRTSRGEVRIERLLESEVQHRLL